MIYTMLLFYRALSISSQGERVDLAACSHIFCWSKGCSRRKTSKDVFNWICASGSKKLLRRGKSRCEWRKAGDGLLPSIGSRIVNVFSTLGLSKSSVIRWKLAKYHHTQKQSLSLNLLQIWKRKNQDPKNQDQEKNTILLCAFFNGFVVVVVFVVFFLIISIPMCLYCLYSKRHFKPLWLVNVQIKKGSLKPEAPECLA